MSIFSNPFDSSIRLSCSCGEHSSQVEHDKAVEGLSGSSEPGSDETFKPDSSSTKTSTSKPPAVEKAVKKQSEAPPEDNYSWD